MPTTDIPAGNGDSIAVDTDSAGNSTITFTDMQVTTGTTGTGTDTGTVSGTTTSTFTYTGTQPNFVASARDQKNNLKTPGHTVVVVVDGHRIVRFKCKETRISD